MLCVSLFVLSNVAMITSINSRLAAAGCSYFNGMSSCRGLQKMWTEPLEWLYSTGFLPFICPLVSHAHPGKLIFLGVKDAAPLTVCVCMCFPGCAGLGRTFTVVQLIKAEHCTVRRAEKDQCSGAYQLCVFMSVFCQRCVCLLNLPVQPGLRA